MEIALSVEGAKETQSRPSQNYHPYSGIGLIPEYLVPFLFRRGNTFLRGEETILPKTVINMDHGRERKSGVKRG